VDTTIGLTVSQRKYLPGGEGEQDLHAIVTVEVAGAQSTAPGPALAEILVVDCSSSMDRPEEKFRAAKNATIAALRLLPDGTPFAVVAGTHHAVTAYPQDAGRSMALADATTRAEAEAAVHGLVAAGGTCVGSWLQLSRQLLAGQSAPIRHALMLTDGRNEHDHYVPLAGELLACAGQFVCDAWGIGQDWDARLLLRVVGALHGGADAVREESDLVGAYERLVRGLLTKAVPELTLTVGTPPGSRLRYVKQTFPTEALMTAEAGEPGAYVTRAWGNQVRRYHVCIAVDPEGQLHGEELLAAEIGVRVPDETPIPPPASQPLVVQWTDDPVVSGGHDDLVLHFQLYEQLGQAVADAADAYRHQQYDRAAEHLGRGVALAHRARARGQLDELRRLVDIHDAAEGVVSLRPDLKAVDFQHLITASSHSAYGPEPGAPVPDPGPQLGASRAPCPGCGQLIPAKARFCTRCGRSLEAS
jgi:hypothetical protein